jgi:hypothetical protein
MAILLFSTSGIRPTTGLRLYACLATRLPACCVNGGQGIRSGMESRYVNSVQMSNAIMYAPVVRCRTVGKVYFESIQINFEQLNPGPN